MRRLVFAGYLTFFNQLGGSMNKRLKHLTLAIASVCLLPIYGCGGGDDSSTGPLSPARQLAGTWKSSIPVSVNFDTEWCNSPAMTLAGSENWDVTWVVTAGATENQVNVQMTFAKSNWKTIAGCPDTGVVPEVSPMFLTGNISATTLTLKNAGVPVGTFTFTTDNMQGDFDYKWCQAYCQREYTTNRAFILQRK